MANSVFPNDISDAPNCTICLEKVIDNAGRSITKLFCGHFFHADCIGSEFNAQGRMICPNCRVIEDGGNWRRFTNFEDDEDEDEYDEEHPSTHEEEMELHAINEEYNGGTSTMRHEIDIDGPWKSIAQDIALQANKMIKLIVQQKKFIEHLTQRLRVQQPPQMVDQWQISSLNRNVGSGLVNCEASTSYDPLPCQERLMPPCQCFDRCRASSSRIP